MTLQMFVGRRVDFVFDWFLPTLSEVFALAELGAEKPQSQLEAEVGETAVYRRSPQRVATARHKAEREWSGAIAALMMLLERTSKELSPSQDTTHGLVISAPSPVLSHPELLDHFSTWTFTVDSLRSSERGAFQLPPAQFEPTIPPPISPPPLSLLPDDPLAAEQFCIVFTANFGLVLVLGEDAAGNPAFLFSFDPKTLELAWQCLRQRVLMTTPHRLNELDNLTKQFAPITPSFQLVTQFSRLMLEHLPEPAEKEEARKARDVAPAFQVTQGSDGNPAFKFSTAGMKAASARSSLDVELLQAIAHEVRTPLTTIRTMTRLLLKRKDLATDVKKRLEIIDRECSEQIDRFNLIFRAVELETTSAKTAAMSLTATSLTEVFRQSIPRWQQQAKQRHLNLDVLLPQQMPTVVSDPTMLDQALTSLIERFTRSLPAGSHIQVEVMLAGDQLKLQLQSQPSTDMECPIASTQPYKPILKSLGQMLTFQPETGILSLNLAVTKNLFQALGGKLIVKERPQHGEVMTVFLPLELNAIDYSSTHIYEV
jgi:signal transduction histidine kinase